MCEEESSTLWVDNSIYTSVFFEKPETSEVFEILFVFVF